MEDPIERAREYQQIIRGILEAFHGVSFPVVVESTTGRRVLPVDRSSETALIDDIMLIARTLAQDYSDIHITRATYEEVYDHPPDSFRPNEVSGVVERLLPRYENTEGLATVSSIVMLHRGGYPDAYLVEESGRKSFLEIKVTTRPNKASPRDFFFTGGKESIRKIDSDGYHLLLGFHIRKITNADEFVIIGWKLVDLAKLEVNLKAEFNATNPDIYSEACILAEEDYPHEPL